jgi:hypothetical protein
VVLCLLADSCLLRPTVMSRASEKLGGKECIDHPKSLPLRGQWDSSRLPLLLSGEYLIHDGEDREHTLVALYFHRPP